MLGSQQINKVMTIVEEEEAGKGTGAFLDGCNYMWDNLSLVKKVMLEKDLKKMKE